MVNETLALYGDWTYGGAVAVYALAMVFYLIEQAFGRVATVRAATRTRELVTVGGGPAGSEPAEPPERPDDRANGGGRAERFGRMAVALTVLGVLLHASFLAMRGVATQRVPWGNMYEYGSALCLAAVVTWLVLLRTFPIRRLGAFVLLPVVMLMFVGGTMLYAPAAPAPPPLQSYWLAVHVFAAASSSGVLLVPGVASVLYLIKVRGTPERPRLARLAAKLPAADTLDRLAYRTTVVAFPVYTVGVICGAIWAEAAWGRFWGWDPKETAAFVAWVVYAAYLHSRATAGWRGARAAVINVVGFAVLVANLFVINLVIAGLHSYAGV